MKKKHGKFYIFLIIFNAIGIVAGISGNNFSSFILFFILLLISLILLKRSPSIDPCEDSSESLIHSVEPFENHQRYKNYLYESSDDIDDIKNNFISVDVETTGLSSTKDRVVEISAQHFVNGSNVEEFTTLINPGIKISKEASNINHITNKMIKNAPTTLQAFNEFCSFIKKAMENPILIAHNAKFDFGFIQAELNRCGLLFNLNFIDTLEMSRELYPDQKNHRLDTIKQVHNIDTGDSHRAKSDAIACGKFFIKSVEYIGTQSRCMRASFSEQDVNVCNYIISALSDAIDCPLMSIYATKEKNGLVKVYANDELFGLRNTKTLHYILLKREYCIGKDIPFVPGNKSEFDYYRYNYKGVDDLNTIKDCIVEKYKDSKKLKRPSFYINIFDKYVNYIKLN